MIIPKEGEILKYMPTGDIFEVKKINNQFVILHSKDGLTQIMTGKRSLDNSFETVSHLNSRNPGLARSS
jgi:hypothetical protein